MRLAKEMHTTPSRLTEVTDPYEAYCLDEACAVAFWRAQQAASETPAAPAQPQTGWRRATKMIDGIPIGTFVREA